MKRVLAVGVGLVVMLVILWACCGNVGYGAHLQAQNYVPKFYQLESEPIQTVPQVTEETTTHKPYACVLAKAFLNFDGPFMENGSQEEMIGVAALELWNTDTTPIEFVQAVVYQGERRLCFEATYIPPGERVLVLEKDAQLYTTEPITDFQCPTVIRMEKPQWQDTVCVQNSGMCNLTITNLTDKQLASVRVFYKGYDVQGQRYVGGITYCLVLTDLEAGAEKTISPYHYVADYNRIVAVITEE